MHIYILFRTYKNTCRIYTYILCTYIHIHTFAYTATREKLAPPHTCMYVQIYVYTYSCAHKNKSALSSKGRDNTVQHRPDISVGHRQRRCKCRGSLHPKIETKQNMYIHGGKKKRCRSVLHSCPQMLRCAQIYYTQHMYFDVHICVKNVVGQFCIPPHRCYVVRKYMCRSKYICLQRRKRCENAVEACAQKHSVDPNFWRLLAVLVWGGYE